MNQVVLLKLDTAHQERIRVTYSLNQQGKQVGQTHGWLPSEDIPTAIYQSWQTTYRNLRKEQRNQQE